MSQSKDTNSGRTYSGPNRYLPENDQVAKPLSQPVLEINRNLREINDFLQTYHKARDNNGQKYYYLGFTMFGYSGKDKLEAVEKLSQGEPLSKRDVAILNQGSLGRQLKAKVTEAYPYCKHNRINELLKKVGYQQQTDGFYTLTPGLEQTEGLQPIYTHAFHNYYVAAPFLFLKGS